MGSTKRLAAGWRRVAPRGTEVLGVAAALLCAALLCASCWVPLPPVSDEGPVRPNLQLNSADPPTSQLLVAEYGDEIKFDIPLSYERSDGLTYQIWLNWDLAPRGDFPFLSGTVTPSQQQTPTVKFTLTVDSRFSRGCQQVTLLVTPSNNITEESDEPKDPRDMDLVAMVTWWFNVDPVGPPDTLENCPLQGSAGDGT